MDLWLFIDFYCNLLSFFSHRGSSSSGAHGGGTLDVSYHTTPLSWIEFPFLISTVCIYLVLVTNWMEPIKKNYYFGLGF
jgi:hypothetical protein